MVYDVNSVHEAMFISTDGYILGKCPSKSSSSFSVRCILVQHIIFLNIFFYVIIFRDIIDFHIFFVAFDNLAFQFRLLPLLLLVWAFSTLIINVEI